MLFFVFICAVFYSETSIWHINFNTVQCHCEIIKISRKIWNYDQQNGDKLYMPAYCIPAVLFVIAFLFCTHRLKDTVATGNSFISLCFSLDTRDSTWVVASICIKWKHFCFEVVRSSFCTRTVDTPQTLLVQMTEECRQIFFFSPFHAF